MAILNLKRKLECGVNLSRLRWGGGGDRGPQVLQHNQNCLKHVYTKQYYPTTLSICTNGRVHTSSLLHANDVSREKKKKKSPQHLYSCPFHVGDIGFFRLALLHSGSWMFQRGRLYCHLFEKAVSRRSVERKCHLK